MKSLIFLIIGAIVWGVGGYTNLPCNLSLLLCGVGGTIIGVVIANFMCETIRRVKDKQRIAENDNIIKLK